MTERLYLYALIRPDDSWAYVGATVNPHARAHKWSRRYPGERFQILMIGDESYVLEMERKLIAHCLARGIPIRNRSAKNRSLIVGRAASRKGGQRFHQVHPDFNGERNRRMWQFHPALMREISRKGGRRTHERHPNQSSDNGRRTWALHPELMREISRKGGRKGGQRCWELHRGVMSAAVRAGNHRRWHEARGLVNPKCAYCALPEAT